MQMMVEFIGSTGAGKTTLIRQIQRSVARKAEVADPFDLVARRLRVRGIQNVSAQHLIQELAGFPYFLRGLGSHKEFVIFALRMLSRQANLSIFTVNNLRSLERKIAVYEIIRRYGRDQIILVDEGTVLAAHNLFVFSESTYTPEEIDHFARLVPLPDKIIYLRVPADVLLQRSLQRADPPREMRAKDRVLIEKYIDCAGRMFDQLTRSENIQRRLMTVDYQDFLEHGSGQVIDGITDFILDKNTAGE